MMRGERDSYNSSQYFEGEKGRDDFFFFWEHVIL